MAVDLGVLVTNDGPGIAISGFSNLSVLFGESLRTPKKIIENAQGESSFGKLQMGLWPMNAAEREIFRRAIVLNEGDDEERRDELVAMLVDGSDFTIWNVTFYSNGALLCFHPQGDVDSTDQVLVSSANIPSAVLRFRLTCAHLDSDRTLTFDYQASSTQKHGHYSLTVTRDDEPDEPPLMTIQQATRHNN